MTTFVAALDIASSRGDPQSRIVFEHSSPSCAELCALLNVREFIVVDELFIEHGKPERKIGSAVLSRGAIKKIRVWYPAEDVAVARGRPGAAKARVEA